MESFEKPLFTAVPKGRVKEVAAMLKPIHAQKVHQAAEEKITAGIFQHNDNPFNY